MERRLFAMDAVKIKGRERGKRERERESLEDSEVERTIGLAL